MKLTEAEYQEILPYARERHVESDLRVFYDQPDDCKAKSSAWCLLYSLPQHFSDERVNELALTAMHGFKYVTERLTDETLSLCAVALPRLAFCYALDRLTPDVLEECVRKDPGSALEIAVERLPLELFRWCVEVDPVSAMTWAPDRLSQEQVDYCSAAAPSDAVRLLAGQMSSSQLKLSLNQCSKSRDLFPAVNRITDMTINQVKTFSVHPKEGRVVAKDIRGNVKGWVEGLPVRAGTVSEILTMSDEEVGKKGWHTRETRSLKVSALILAHGFERASGDEIDWCVKVNPVDAVRYTAKFLTSEQISYCLTEAPWLALRYADELMREGKITQSRLSGISTSYPITALEYAAKYLSSDELTICALLKAETEKVAQQGLCVQGDERKSINTLQFS